VNENGLPAGRPDPATSVAGYLRARPAGSRVFLEHRMACVGCSLSEFDTLADAAREYRLPLDAFLDRLAGAEPGPAAPPPADFGDRR
jgi:hybrid cluster-associated redox disulfide protein